MSSLKAKILDYLQRYPSARNVDIATWTGATSAYVCVVRKRHGFPRHPRKAHGTIILTPENSDWLMSQISPDLNPSALVNAIITDARLEEQEPSE